MVLALLADDQVDLARYAARHRHPGDRDDFSPWKRRRGSAVEALVFTHGVAVVECVPSATTRWPSLSCLSSALERHPPGRASSGAKPRAR